MLLAMDEFHAQHLLGFNGKVKSELISGHEFLDSLSLRSLFSGKVKAFRPSMVFGVQQETLAMKTNPFGSFGCPS